jgi:hypothetical protein
MTFKKWAVRLVLFAGGVVLSLVLLTFLTVQFQQRMLRWRAERLLADMHQIRLYQSSWADAQRLMTRWGAWGHYDGSCTAESCKYEIEMDIIASLVQRHAWLGWLLRRDRLNLYQWFGGRDSGFRATFTVHDGTIWRESSAIGVSIPRRRMHRYTDVDTILVSDDIDTTLSIGAESYQRLHRTVENPFLHMGDSEDELAQHPYYKVGRPSGCMINCQIGIAYYSTHTPPSEIVRLTSYDFSCFTRFNPCAHIEDLLPTAKEWHLYDDAYESSPTVPKPSPLPPPCSNIPVGAQARDARYVWQWRHFRRRSRSITRTMASIFARSQRYGLSVHSRSLLPGCLARSLVPTTFIGSTMLRSPAKVNTWFLEGDTSCLPSGMTEGIDS